MGIVEEAELYAPGTFSYYTGYFAGFLDALLGEDPAMEKEALIDYVIASIIVDTMQEVKKTVEDVKS